MLRVWVCHREASSAKRNESQEGERGQEERVAFEEGLPPLAF